MRVLFLTHRVPYTQNRGDRIRAFQLIRQLAPHVDLEVVSLAHDPSELAQIDLVRQMGVRASAALVPRVRNHVRAAIHLAGNQTLTHLLLDSPGLHSIFEEIATERPPDVVFAYCTGMARFALEPPLNRHPLVIDFVDVDSEKWRALAESQTTSPLMRWIYAREARLLAAFEARAAHAARANIVVNQREGQALRAIAPDATIHVVESGIEQQGAPPRVRLGTAPAVAFCGVMNYPPNVEGVLWFAREVWPHVKAGRADARFVVIGSEPTRDIWRLASENLGIEVTGAVPEVQSHLARCAVAVAPLATARGVQNKVLEALSAGLPGVITSPVAAGLPAEALTACRVADRARDFADHTLRLLALSDYERHLLIRSVRLEKLTWERRLEPVLGILASAAGATRPVAMAYA